MLATAAPLDVDDRERQKRDNGPVPILSSEFETSADGGYSFRYTIFVQKTNFEKNVVNVDRNIVCIILNILCL